MEEGSTGRKPSSGEAVSKFGSSWGVGHHDEFLQVARMDIN